MFVQFENMIHHPKQPKGFFDEDLFLETGRADGVDTMSDTDNGSSVKSDDSYCSTKSDMLKNAACSTPVKVGERLSVSLLDMSDLDFPLSKGTASCETIQTQSSMDKSKDSGYSSVGPKTYSHVESKVKKYICDMKENREASKALRPKASRSQSETDVATSFRKKMEEEMHFKDVLIGTLQETNNHLRLKNAIAENKISELRMRCEMHCKCCSLYGSKSQQKPPWDADTGFLVPKFYPTRPTDTSFLRKENRPQATAAHQKTVSTETGSSPPRGTLQNHSLTKVKRWQESSSVNMTTQTEGDSLERVSSPQPPVTHFQVFGQQSVSVSPKARIALTLCGDKGEGAEPPPRRHPTQPAPLICDIDCYLRGRECPPPRLDAAFRQAKVWPGRTAGARVPSGDGSVLAEKRWEESVGYQRSRNLIDCLAKADEYADLLSKGLSQLPRELDNVRALALK